MNKLSQYKVSTRMIGLFVIIFSLSLFITFLSLHQLRGVSSSFEEIMKDPMKKYQAANDWYVNSNGAIMRTTVISKSRDTSLTASFAELAKETKAKADEYQATFEKLIVSDKEKELFNNIANTRKQYLASRDVIQNLKNEGKMDEAEQHFNEVYLPAAKVYTDSLDQLVDLEFESITSTGQVARQTYENSKTTVLVLTAITLIIGIGLSILITRSILRDLGGEPSYAIEMAQTISSGDLSQKINFKDGDTVSVLYNLCMMRKNLQSIIKDIRSGSDTIESATVEIAQGNQDLSYRTETQASNLEETASAMEQLNTTVKQNADNAHSAQNLVEKTVKNANESGVAFNQVMDNMHLIKDSSKKISEITSVIDGIAFQTNILALNAAVEAARAGEQGRGFAVVATEVRTLAQRSAAAAKEIKDLISDSVEKVERGVDLATKAGTNIQEVVGNVESVSVIVSEITQASKEQALGIEEVTKAVAQMDHVTQQNAALVEEAAAAATMLQEQTKHMNGLVGKFVV